MSDYGSPQDPGQPWQYPDQAYAGGPYPPPAGTPPYAGGPYPPPPPPPASGAGLSIRLGERLFRRPEPRLTVAIGGAGAAMAIFGVLLWGSDYYGGANSASTSRNLLGAGLSAIATAVGYLLMIRRRSGAGATAGAVAAGIGLPLTIAFLTLDATSHDPMNIDAVFWVSALGWLVSYLFLPGARGRTFFVFLLATGFVTYLLIKNATDFAVNLVFSPTGAAPRVHGFGTIAAIGLVFGLAYYVLAFLFDRTGRHGPATGLVFPAFAATAIGLLAWSPTLHATGTGIITVLLGAVVCAYGGRFGRRATCFAAAAAVVFGVSLVVGDAISNNNTAAGITLIIVGIATVASATALASALRERDEMDPEAVVRAR